MKAVASDAFSIWLMAKKLKGRVVRKTGTHAGSNKIKMNTAPRRSARIAAKMATAAPVAARRSPRIAAKPTAAPVAVRSSPRIAAKPTAAPVAPQQPLRRSARIAAKTQSHPSHGVTPSHWANMYYTGLSWDLCKKLDTNIARVREWVTAVDTATGVVNKVDAVMGLFQYLYTNELLLLRVPSFRTAAMNKMEEILTTTQMRALRAQHKLWKKKYIEMTTHPLYRP